MKSGKGVALVGLGALGVVFGDIGTSPLYALRQVFHDDPGFAHDPQAVLGVLSLVLWSIVLVVCVKYVGLVLRVDHRGEGGTLAMLGLLHATVDPTQDASREDSKRDDDGAGGDRPEEDEAAATNRAGEERRTGASPACGERQRQAGGRAGADDAGPEPRDGARGAPDSAEGLGDAACRTGAAAGRARPGGDGASDKPPPPLRERPDWLTLLVLFASALLFGDGMVTPAISVLSAVEGLGVATSAFKPWVLPLSVAILAGLFLLQSHGTARVGRLFGPVMLAWFATLGAVGLASVLAHPAVLAALSPWPALRFLVGHGWAGPATLGAVVLAFSGVEALFADLGHFGRRPITLAWYCVVLPGLALNYLGQGGLVLADPQAGAEPFFGLLAHWALVPVVVLSTLAAIIASQALISGAFSLTQQAVNMGYAPRYAIRHTSAEAAGQVYMPVVNVVLMLGCIGIVLGFRSSDALGAAYGLAVIGTMTITSVVYYIVLRRVRGWSRGWALPLVGAFLLVEGAFLAANLVKLLSGAWLPLAIALVLFAVMSIWTDGRARYRQALAQWQMPIEEFREHMRAWDREAAADETAVLLTSDLDTVPLVGRHTWLLSHLRSRRVLLLKVQTTALPVVGDKRRVEVEDLGDGLYRAVARFGFMQAPRAGSVLPDALPFAWDSAVFYLAEPLSAARGTWFERWRMRVFLFLGSTGLSPIEFFHIPPNQTVSVGMEIEL